MFGSPNEDDEPFKETVIDEEAGQGADVYQLQTWTMLEMLDRVGGGLGENQIMEKKVTSPVLLGIAGTIASGEDVGGEEVGVALRK